MVKKVSVIIPVYNRLNIFSQCLKTLYKQNYKNLEVIVIDDNSTEPVSEFVRANYSQVKVIRNRRKRYPSFVKNQGILLSTGEYILFLDSDIRFIKEDTILNLVMILESDEKIGGVGGEALLDDKNNVISVSGVKFLFNKDRVIDIRDTVDKKTKRKIVDVIDTSNLMTKRSLLFEIGGFDPNYFYPHEDSDLCYRLRKKGYIIVIDFNSGVIHQRNKEYRMPTVYFTARARIRYQIKHLGIFKTNYINCLHEPTLSIVVNFFRNRFFNKFQQILKSQGQIQSALKKISCPDSIFLSTKINNFLYFYFFEIIYFIIALLKANIWNIVHLNGTLSSRSKNFLEDKRLLEAVKGYS